jgi:hypothetical protein
MKNDMNDKINSLLHELINYDTNDKDIMNERMNDFDLVCIFRCNDCNEWKVIELNNGITFDLLCKCGRQS